MGEETGRRSAARIVMLGLFSGLLYVAMYVVHRTIHTGPAGDAFTVALGLYPIITIGTFALYVWLLALLRLPLTRGARRAAFGFPVLFSLFWLPMAPMFSSDVFAYILHGHVQLELGANPYLVHSSAVASSPLGWELLSYGWRPVHPATPYGPVLTYLERAVVWLCRDDVRLSMLLFKLVAIASSLAVAAIIWRILQRVRPQDRDLGTLAYLWNPAVVAEVAGEGHNDSTMALLALAAVFFVVERRVVAGPIAMAAAALTKYVPLLLVPVLTAHLWHGAEKRRSRFWLIAGGVVTGAAMTVILYAPFWAGLRTFAGLRLSAHAGHTGSTQTFLVELLSLVISEQSARGVVSVAVTATLALAAILMALVVRTPSEALRASAVLMVMYTVFSPAYWPWYVVLPVALLALLPRGTFLVLLVALSLGSRLAAPLNSLYVDAVIDRPAFFLLTWLCAIGVPVLAVWASRRQRHTRVVSNCSRWALRFSRAGGSAPVRGSNRTGAGQHGGSR